MTDSEEPLRNLRDLFEDSDVSPTEMDEVVVEEVYRNATSHRD